MINLIICYGLYIQFNLIEKESICLSTNWSLSEYENPKLYDAENNGAPECDLI